MLTVSQELPKDLGGTCCALWGRCRQTVWSVTMAPAAQLPAAMIPEHRAPQWSPFLLAEHLPNGELLHYCVDVSFVSSDFCIFP
eukprot:3015942-Amphidinium_carterae.1